MPAHRIGLARLRGRHPIEYLLVPDAGETEALRAALGLTGLRKVRLAVTLSPEGAADWRLTGRLGATVTQPCVVTLEPVTTRIEEDVVRHFRPRGAPGPETIPEERAETEAGTEVEIELDEDEIDSETIGAGGIDLGAVLEEALALALPLYPRAAGAALEEAQFAADGITPMSDEAAHPFAGLAGLRARLEDDSSGEDTGESESENGEPAGGEDGKEPQ